MNAGTSHTHESHFGPGSEPISVAQFVQSGQVLFQSSPANEIWEALTDDKRDSIAAECSVGDIKSTLLNTLDNPFLSSHVFKSHEATVNTIHETADPSNRRKRKRLPDPSLERNEVIALRNKIDSTQLKSWPLSLDAALFMRTPKNADHNTLIAVKKTSSVPLPSDIQGLLTISVYNRRSWDPRNLSRSSQHVVLSSQTLGDFFEAIPCTSNELPKERLEDGHMVGYEPQGEQMEGSTGCVICIEGVAYGDGQKEEDYADILLEYIQQLPDNKRPSLKKGPFMHDTPFSSLTLRMNEPYWLLHQGNCEHFFVVEQIRLLHPTDPTSGYPLTVQVTPSLLDLCRACSKVPAVYSIVGDARLGESPCVLCGPCWRNMGESSDEDVLVVPLPKYEIGW